MAQGISYGEYQQTTPTQTATAKPARKHPVGYWANQQQQSRQAQANPGNSGWNWQQGMPQTSLGPIQSAPTGMGQAAQPIYAPRYQGSGFQGVGDTRYPNYPGFGQTGMGYGLNNPSGVTGWQNPMQGTISSSSPQMAQPFQTIPAWQRPVARNYNQAAAYNPYVRQW